MAWIRSLVEVDQMAALTGLGRAREAAADVAGVALNLGVRTRERKFRAGRVVKLRALPL